MCVTQGTKCLKVFYGVYLSVEDDQPYLHCCSTDWSWQGEDVENENMGAIESMK